MSLHHRQSATRDRGATILEFLIYVALVGAILVTVTQFSSEFIAAQAKTLVLNEVAQNARFAVSRMEAEIRGATGVNVGASTFGSSPGTLSISQSAPAVDPTVFTLTSGVLTMQQGAGAAVPITGSKVEVLEFVVNNVSVTGKTRAVQLRLRIRHANSGNLVEFTAETTVETTVRIPLIDGFSS
jgi:Tfp pilus assembly protein PilW